MVTAAGTTSYDRDELGRVTGVTDPVGGHYALTRDDAGRVVSVDFPNGVSEAYTYDSAGRPLTVTVAQGGAVLGSFEVTRDEAGRIATFLDSFDTDTQSGSFDYDAGGRLTGASSTDGAGSSSSAFTLDAAGNRTEVTGDGAESASFNALDQLVSDGDATYSYDASGFLTQITDGTGTTDLSFSSAGELLGVDGPAGAVSYAYDPSGVLVSRTDSTGTVGFVNDASMSLPHAVAGTDGSWWVYAGSRPLAQATPDGQVHYLHEDPRGDVRLVTDAAGAVTDTFTYDVDGQVTTRTGTTAVSVGWNGEYTDAATGMVWLRARWYDPASARFITADPWQGNPANPVSLNRYLYANADPVNNTDPSGLQTYVDTLSEMEIQSILDGIAQATYSAMLRQVIADVVALTVTATGATLAALALIDDPHSDNGIDGPGTVPDMEVHERDSTETELQPQTDGAGARSGGPVGCEADPGAFEGTSTTQDGLVYMRTDLLTGATYIGQAKNWSRYETRQKEHRRANPTAEYRFKVMSRADAGTDLDRVEQYYIDACGGPTNKSNPDGSLDNKRNQMNPDRYQQNGGDPWQ